jgi:putative ABC transport system substrate-binding protein
MQFDQKRREVITLLGGAAAAWPLAARAQQVPSPVVGFLEVGGRSHVLAAFQRGLAETGYVAGQNVAIEVRTADQYDRFRELAAELVHRNVALIATAINAAALAAKATTTTIPIVFATGVDPVEIGLVASLNRPGGNVTGISFLSAELVEKRLALLHELVPAAARVAVLVNPTDPVRTESTTKDVEAAARTIGLQIRVLNASTSREIDAAFATLGRDRADALFVAADAFLNSRRVQFATLATRHGVPSAYSNRAVVEAGALMSYGTDTLDMFRQVGVYTGQILRGAKPADLPVLQSTKFEFVINLQTARALGLEVPNALQLLADEVIE